MLSSPVLVLNRSYFPVHVTDVRRAFCLLCRGVAKVVDEQYRTFDFEDWTALSVAVRAEEGIGTVAKIIRAPKVILLVTYDRLPKREVRFSRMNVMIRDNFACQYCGKHFKKSEMNLDHVVPRSQGGKTAWENVVSSCHPCNHKKGGRSPKQAGIHLIRLPFRPKNFPFSQLMSRSNIHEAWKPYLNIVDFSYWNVELEP